jgi:hypothetical protein
MELLFLLAFSKFHDSKITILWHAFYTKSIVALTFYYNFALYLQVSNKLLTTRFNKIIFVQYEKI